MNATTPIKELVDNYYNEFATAGDFSTVPMAPDLKFSGPMHTYADGGRYRRDCAELASNVMSIAMRHQFVEGNTAVSVYDFDLGLPTGPIPSSETLTFGDGVLIAAELIFDSTPLRPPVNS